MHYYVLFFYGFWSCLFIKMLKYSFQCSIQTLFLADFMPIYGSLPRLLAWLASFDPFPFPFSWIFFNHHCAINLETKYGVSPTCPCSAHRILDQLGGARTLLACEQEVVVAVAVSYGGKGARGGGGSEMHSGRGWSKLHIISHSIFFRTYALPVGEGLLFAWCVGVEKRIKSILLHLSLAQV